MSILNYPTSLRVYDNVRFACWSAVANERGQWPVLLMGWLQRPGKAFAIPASLAWQDAEAVLTGQRDLTHEEIDLVAQALGRDSQELAYEDWPQAKPKLILHENLKRLLGDTGSQTKGHTAEMLGVSPQTLSRWLGGDQMPDARAKRAIVTLFGLRDVEELETSPIFLSYLPVTHAERLAWLQDRLRNMPWHELRELFPALQRLFSKPPQVL